MTVVAPLRLATPLEDHLAEAGLLVKREDLSCLPPGPPFSKTRGVFSHVRSRVEAGVKLFGALDTFHSQAGHAVAHACRVLGVECLNFFPVYKADLTESLADIPPRPGEPALLYPYGSAAMKLRPPQLRSQELGAKLSGLPAGRSAVLYHQAKRQTEEMGGYMMPNALKLPETVTETAAEVVRTFEHATREQFDVLRSSPWLIACSSATIASGVIQGLHECIPHPQVILHMGYSRSREAVRTYLNKRLARPADMSWAGEVLNFIDEGYAYKDQAKPGPTPPWPCNPYYDLKAVRWWLREGREQYGRAVLWNIG